MSSVVLHPFCQHWTSLEASAVILRPNLAWGKMCVKVKAVLPSQLCCACGTMLLCFWSQSLQRAVALASGCSVISPSVLDNKPVMGITEDLPEAGCGFGNNDAASKELQTAPTTARSSSIPCSCPGLLHVFTVPSWDLELMLHFPPERPLSEPVLLGEMPCLEMGGLGKPCCRCAGMPFGL